MGTDVCEEGAGGGEKVAGGEEVAGGGEEVPGGGEERACGKEVGTQNGARVVDGHGRVQRERTGEV